MVCRLPRWGTPALIITARKQKFVKVMFLHLSVSHSVHGGRGCLPHCRLRYIPLGRYTTLDRYTYPPGQVPPIRYTPSPWQVPPGRYTPWTGTPWAGTPPGQVHPSSWAGTPNQVHPSPWQVPPGRYTPWTGTPLGRYTPYPWQVHPPLGRYTPQTGTPPPGR